MATAVAPQSWKDRSIHGIRVAQTFISRGEEHLANSREQDPLPLLRDCCVRDSNNVVHNYMRHSRSIVSSLRQNLVETNEEIKALNRGKEALEKALEEKRKDVALNEESVQLRTHRPSREKEEDGADRLLTAERAHLCSLKRSLESQLRKVQKALQMLSVSRSRLGAIIQERSRVLDLLCHNQTKSTTFAALPSTRGSLVSRGSASMTPRPRHTRSTSAPTSAAVGVPLPNTFAAQPNPLVAECNAAITQATDARERSRQLRQELATTVDHTHRLQQAAHHTVNEGIIKKIAATVTLKQHLGVNAGDTKAAINRGQHQYHTLNHSQGTLLGPVSFSDVETREKLDRPLVSVYQRHPDTDLPEAFHLLQAKDALTDSITTTRRNLQLLRLAENQLKGDITDKHSAANVDMNIVRLRRRKANHKWVLSGPK